MRGVNSGANDARGAGVPESGLSLEDELEVAPIDADEGAGGIPLEDDWVKNGRDEADDDDDAEGNNVGGGAPIAGAEGAIG